MQLIDRWKTFCKKHEEQIEDVGSALWFFAGAGLVYFSAVIVGIRGETLAEGFLEKAKGPTAEELGSLIELIKIMYFIVGAVMWIGITAMVEGASHFIRKWRKRRERICLP